MHEARVGTAGSSDSLLVDTYDDYLRVDSPSRVLGPGNRIFEAPIEASREAPDVEVLVGRPGLNLDFARRPIQLRVVKVESVLYLPRRVVINLANRKLLLDALRKPEHGLSENTRREMRSEIIDRALASPRLQRVVEPTFCAAARNTGYGHVLLEAVSQLWPSPDLDLSRMRVAVNAVRGDYNLGLIRPFGVREDNLLRLGVRPVLFEQLVVASQSYVIPRRISERFWTVAGLISNYYADGVSGRRLYVSRTKARKRLLVNESEIARAFERHAFEVLHPEELSVADQVRLFSGAEWVAGPVGSGLYNSVFSRRDVRRIILAPSTFFTPNDVLMSGGHGPTYMFGESPARNPKIAVSKNWTIDHGAVAAALDGLFPLTRNDLRRARPGEGFAV